MKSLKSAFILLSLICCASFFQVEAQSPQERLLARRAAGIDGYRNLIVKIKQYYVSTFPSASTTYFDNHPISFVKGAKRLSFNYTQEGCFVEMELPGDAAVVMLSEAAKEANINFGFQEESDASDYFGPGVRVKGFGKYPHRKKGTTPMPEENPEIRGEKTTEPVEPPKKDNLDREFGFDKGNKSPEENPSKKPQYKTRIENYQVREDGSPRWKDLDYELDLYLQKERRKAPERKWSRYQRRAQPSNRDGWTRGPVRTYEWQESYRARTQEELDAMIDRAIEDALRRWRQQRRQTESDRAGWRKVREYVDPVTGERVEEYVRESKTYIE